MKIPAQSCLTAGLILLAMAMPTRADYSSTVSSFNPLGYWRFSEATVSPPLNQVTNASTLGRMIDGAVILDATKGEAGIVGNSVRFRNPDVAAGYCGSKVDVPFNTALNKSGLFSVECWVKPNALGSDGTGMAVLSSMMNDFTASSRTGFLLYMNNAGRFEFRLGNASGYVGTVNNAANPSFNAATNVWRHVVCVFDGARTVIFVNGTNVASRTLTPAEVGTLRQNTQMPFRIGGTPFNGSLSDSPLVSAGGVSGNRGIDSWVDEVAYYPYALTTNQCAAHFAAATTNNAGYTAQILADGPVGYWPMNEPAYPAPNPATFPVATNSGTLGSAADGTVLWGGLAAQSGAAYAGFGGGNSAVLLDGANGYVKIGKPAGLDISGNITMMAWVKPTVKNFFRNIIGRGWNQDYEETFLRISRGGDNAGYGRTNFYEVGASDGTTYETARFTVPEGDIGNWVFIAGTYNGSSWTLYRNGQQVATTASGLGARVTTNAWAIGAQSEADLGGSFGDPGGISTFFGGHIDEPAIFNTALSSTDINNIYNAAEVPPVITRAVTAAPLLFRGRSASLSVWAEGSLPLSYQWYSNGIPLGVTSTNLTLSNLQIGTPTYSVVVTNVYGSSTSSMTLTIDHAAPFVTKQPVPLSRFVGSPFSFSATAGGSLPLTFQWRTNGTDIAGATTGGVDVGDETVGSYSSTASLANAGNYTVAVSNAAGGTTSAPAALIVFPTATGYAASVLANSPIAYWRLGETSGSIAYDFIGANNGTYFNTTLNQPGYSGVDSNTAAAFGGDNSYVGLISGSAINFEGTNTSFTIECWANGPEGQTDESTLIAKGTGAEGTTGNEQFALDIAFGHYRFLTRGNNNVIYSAEAAVGPDGTWHHVVGVYDQSNPASPEMRIYVNGELSGSGPGRPLANNGVRGSTANISIGSKRLGNAPVLDGTFTGTIDEVAIYSSALGTAAIQAQYGSAYGVSTMPQIGVQPRSVTNYTSLSATFTVGAFGSVPLNFQWKKDNVDIGGANGRSYTINSLTAGDAGAYSVAVSNSAGSTNSAAAILTVLPVPTSAPAIPGLVLHLPFDSSLTDVTGRGNNGTAIAQTHNSSNTASPAFVAGQIGQAYHYQSDFGPATSTPEATTTTNTTYVTLGVKPDLQFSSNVNFTVAFWIRLPVNYLAGDLPFFTTTSGSLGGHGMVFAPAYGYGNGSGDDPDPAPLNYGGWGTSLYDTGAANGARVYGDLGSINDGGYHHLVYVFERNSQVVTYLDGAPAKSFKITGTTTAAAKDIDTGLPATIGQDPTGIYAETGSGDIDDLGIWRKALTPLEAASLYVAGVNNLSFTNAPLSPIVIERVGNSVTLTWPIGALQSSDTINGTFTDVPGATSPFTVAPSAAMKFYTLRP